MIVVGSAEVVRKEARTADERARLEREGQILTFALHPGVVELLAVEPGALILRRVGGAVRSQCSQRQVAALGAAIATVLADLHDIGVVHGRVEASHVLLDPDGRPVLCGFGDGTCPGLPGVPASPSAAGDVAALGFMLASMLDPTTSGRLAKALAEAAQDRPARRPTARRLARTLVDLAADARPARIDSLGSRLAAHPARRAKPTRYEGAPRRRGGVTVAAAVAVAVAAAVAVAVAVAVLGLTFARGRAGRTTGPQPVVLAGGVVVTATGRYRIGAPGDQIVLGRWRCHAGGDPLPAVLRTSTGEVWAFDGWATPARVLDARLLARVSGASRLRVATAGPGCDRLVVIRRAGPPVTLAG